MRHIIRYQALVIPNKLRCEVRMSIDDRFQTVYHGINENGESTAISLRPFIVLSMIRPNEVDENGQRIRSQWDANESLSMTKYNMPVLLEELSGINKDMKIPELYSYHAERLELNEEIAQKIRRVFMIGNTTLELSAQVVTQPDESQVEGIKLKYNNEQYAVMLTLNDLTALVYTLDHLDVDTLSIALYQTFVNRKDHPTVITPNTLRQTVDILPKGS